MNSRPESKSEKEQQISIEEAKKRLKKALPHLDQTLLDKNGNPNKDQSSYDPRFLPKPRTGKLEVVKFDDITFDYVPLKGSR